MLYYRNKIIFLLFIITFILICILLSPLLNIKDINIINNNYVKKDEIISLTNLNKETNIFAISKIRLKKSLMKNPYIKNVNINKNYFLRSIDVDIEEKKIIGYIKFDQDIYIYIDKQGRILDIKSYFIDPLPIVIGLKFSEIKLGDILNIENKSAFNIVLVLSHLFEKYKINNIMKVDVSDEEDLCFYYGKIHVKIGNISDIDEKIRIITSILPEIENMKDIGGNLIIRDVNKQWIFKLLL